MRGANKSGGNRALSQVVTSLILVVSSVLMASGTVTYYALTIRSIPERQEQLTIGEAHVWVNASGAQAALFVQNTGGVDASIGSIEIRGRKVPWVGVYYAFTSACDLIPVQALNITDPFSCQLGGVVVDFRQASGSVALPMDGTAIFYANCLDLVDVSAIGTFMSVTVKTSTSEYVEFVSVETA
jgi:hypothetical protein